MRRRSPGAARATITVFPSACARPSPPGRIRSMVTSMSDKLQFIVIEFRSGLPPAWSGVSPTLNKHERIDKLKFVGHLSRVKGKTDSVAAHRNALANAFAKDCRASARAPLYPCDVYTVSVANQFPPAPP